MIKRKKEVRFSFQCILFEIVFCLHFVILVWSSLDIQLKKSAFVFHGRKKVQNVWNDRIVIK